ncbi:MAG: hypothetical protein AB8H80_07145 [Planctomycetota bacterium]
MHIRLTMKAIARASIAFLALALAAPSPPPNLFEMLPHPSLYRMANIARAIVEGSLGADGAVTITHRFYVEKGEQVADTIRVQGLAGMPRTVDARARRALGAAVAQPVQPDTVLLFLAERTVDKKWQALHHYGKAARGVVWNMDGELHGFAQRQNPGPYRLVRWQDQPTAFRDETAKSARALIQKALAARAQWQQTLAIAEQEDRAQQLLRWFSANTSPDGEW